MSGNPFRRNAPGNVKLQAEEKRIERTPSPFKIGKKEKRVKIQTPPQSPEEEAPRRLSAGRVSPPPPEKDSSSEDDSDTTATADSDIEQAVLNTRRNSGSLAPPGTLRQLNSGAQSPAISPGPGAAPYNPFARTLATSEAAFGPQRAGEGLEEGAQVSKADASGGGGGGGKKAMDVDMFKNILMTGSPAPTPPHQQTLHQPQQDSSSNTDTSSVSKHSLFDQNYNIHPESPRSSFDHNDYSDNEEADDEKGGLMGASKERLDDFAPPAPPKPGQPARATRGPQTVSFADFDDFSPMEERSQSPANAAWGGKHKPPRLHRTASDLNKPLPKTPPRSPGLPPPDQQQPFSLDTQVAQPPTPTVTSPDETTKKAPPPPPPTSRRVGQTGSSHTRARSTSDATTQEPRSPQAKAPDTAGKGASPAPPPPPPSRKTKPTSHAPSPAASTPASEAPPAAAAPTEPTENKPMQPPPAPAPRRHPSTKAAGPPSSSASVHRTPSNASHHSIPSHGAPPAPPPRRAAGSKRESWDGAGREASFESARSRVEEKGRGEGDGKEHDILADMTAFQAEVEALRRRAEGGG